jgi:hypothetical protein
VRGFWAWWSLHEVTILIVALLANALMWIGAAWFLPPEQGGPAVLAAFLLLVAWGILSAVADFKRKAQREHEFEHLFDGRETPPSILEINVELRRLELLDTIDRMQREDPFGDGR